MSVYLKYLSQITECFSNSDFHIKLMNSFPREKQNISKLLFQFESHFDISGYSDIFFLFSDTLMFLIFCLQTKYFLEISVNETCNEMFLFRSQLLSSLQIFPSLLLRRNFCDHVLPKSSLPEYNYGLPGKGKSKKR